VLGSVSPDVVSIRTCGEGRAFCLKDCSEASLRLDLVDGLDDLLNELCRKSVPFSRAVERQYGYAGIELKAHL
jgi:hypothetical protein